LFKNKAEYFAFLILAGLFRILGITLSRKLAGALGSFFYYVVPIRKKTVIENLTAAFPEKSSSEILKLTKKSYRNFSLTFAELLMMQFITEEQLHKIVDFTDSRELLEKYFNSGKSFFILSGHFGNWELFAAFPSFFGGDVHAMAKPMRNKYVSDWINKSRKKLGLDVVLLGSSIRELYKVLKENGIVLSIGDQRGPSDGVRVNYFGKSTAVFNGTAVFALKSHAPIVMVFIVRQKDLNYKVIAEVLEYEDLTGTDEEKIQIICQRYFTFLESVVRKYPDQWFWMHKIWKY
jgi:KDO2-lipid IV(A) lauroyltransferase